MANSKRKCANCENRYKADTMFIHGLQAFCNRDAWIEYCSVKNKPALIKKGNKIRAAKDKADKESIKLPSKWLSEAQTEVNKYIRIRDIFEPCIACNKAREVIEAEQSWKVGGCWDAGHFQSRGAKGQLRFVLFNINKQCKSCNAGSSKFSAKAATVDANYKANLIKKIGIEKVEALENNNAIDHRKKDIDYLKRVKKIFAKKARLYKTIRRVTPRIEDLAA
jgi:hypothetical protein